MHSIMNRANTLLTFFGTVAACLCVLTAMTDLIHRSDPDVSIALHEVKKLVRNQQSGLDQAIITFNLTADLRPAFSWNTKQLFVFMQADYLTPENKLNHVVLWDSIIQSKEQAVLRLRKHKTKYAFVDQARGLRGTLLKLSLHWDIMPNVGYFQIHSKSFDVGKLPSTYT